MKSTPFVKLSHRGIGFFEKMMQGNIPFSFPRYGDGEFSSILGYSGQNCDGVRYTSDLQTALVETLIYPHLNDNYYYGLLAIAHRYFRPYIERFTVKNNLDIHWTEATFLVAANRKGKLGSFLNILRNRPLLYVGPKYLREISEMLGLPVEHFIDVPEKHAFEARVNIANKILVYADKADFIGFSAGPVTKWLIWTLYPALGETHTMFDLGSIFDGYVGRPSRKYQKRGTWQDIVRLNLQ